MPAGGGVPQVESAALQAVIATFRADPEMARFNTSDDVGGCWNTSHRFAWYCHEAGVRYSFRRWVNLPGCRTPRQHTVEVDGLIVDATLRQIFSAVEWPHVEPVAAFEARGFRPAPEPICATCGTTARRHSCEGIVYDPVDSAVEEFLDANRELLDGAVSADVLIERARGVLEARARTLEVLSGRPKVGRNDPCPCGSGVKAKKCSCKRTVTPAVSPAL